MALRNDNSSRWQIKIKHRNWREACAKAFAMLTMAAPGEVVCIVGPSRVGKSELVKELVKRLCGDNDFDKTGLLPVVVVSAANTGPKGMFLTKSFTLRMLEAVRNPVYSRSDDLDGDDLLSLRMNRTTEAIFRLALERGLIIRKTQFLIIDETQHIGYASKGAQDPCAIMDSLKCLAESAQVVLVIVGAYPILNIIEGSPHLTARMHEIHFPRYYADDTDLKEFAKILMAYEEIMDLHASASPLVKHIEMLYEGSFGCIGLLAAWLKRASAFAIAGNQKVTLKLLEEAVLSYSSREGIANEIYTGEEKIYGRNIELVSNIKETKKLKKNNSKPFQRKPVRMEPGNRLKGKRSGN